jgi:enoyl-CoA hydratase
LVLACDLVVAGRGARFGVPEVKRSLVAAGGAALLLPQRVPRAVALELLLTGEPMDAARAADVGLVNRVVDDGKALDAAVGLAEVIGANGPLAVAATKQIVQSVPSWTPEEMWDRQEDVVAPVFGSEDAREGSTAFAERRPPVWRGR